MATKLAQVVGYVDQAVKKRIEHLAGKHRFLTNSVIVSMAISNYLPELEKAVAKGRLPQLVSPRLVRG